MEKNVSTAVEQEVTEQTAPAAEQTNDKLVKLAKARLRDPGYCAGWVVEEG